MDAIDNEFPIVAIGASAGGLEALERFFARVPDECGLAFVVIQHLSPDHKSMMAELLSRHTALRIRIAAEGDAPEPNTITLIPPKSILSLENGRFQLVDKPTSPTLTMPIDVFFTSLAKERKEHSVGVVLSGTGSDGTRGVRAIRTAGGVVLVQLPNTARFDGMPRSALDTGAADLVAAPEDMPLRLVQLAREGTLGPDTGPPLETPADELQQIFQLVHDSSGVNFGQYKLSTVSRRIARRMVVHQVGGIAAYLEIVRSSAGEREALFRDLLIGVTEFFRDGEAWNTLKREVLAPLVRNTPEHGSLRLWVAGCSTGEEAYSLATVVHEELEEQRRSLDVKIFATDVDKQAIDVAARGLYSESAVADISPARLSRYFMRRGEMYEVAPTLRRMILFAQHNLTRDPPFTKLDLVTCRNVLIYFDQGLQEKVISGFHFGLRDGGALWLGSSESLGPLNEFFKSIDARQRLFRAIGTRAGLPWMDDDTGRSLRLGRSERNDSRTMTEDSSSIDSAVNTMLSTFAPPALLVNESLTILHVFGNAGAFLQVSPGKASLRISDMASPELTAMVASGVPRVLRTGEPVVFGPAAINAAGDLLTVRILPSRNTRSDTVNALIAFEAPPPLSDQQPLAVDDITARHLADLSRELEHSRLEQQALVEELEASNEELQATNEELLASNEELQATNEELQSVNEELHTVNSEYQQKIEQLQVVSLDLDHLLEVTDIGTVFLDGDLHIRKFTPSISNYLPLLPTDVGRPLNHLRSELLQDFFIAQVRQVLIDGSAYEQTIDSIAGPVLIRVLPYQHHQQPGLVVTFTNVTEVKRTYELARSVLDSLPAQVAFIGPDGTIRLVNRAWEQFAADNGGDPTAFGVGCNYFEVCAWDPQGREFAKGLRSVLDGSAPAFTIEYPCHAPDEMRWFVARCLPMSDGNAVVVHFDVTPQKRAEQTLSEVATHDYLTGLLNRRGFADQLTTHREAASRNGTTLIAVMIDVDDFKQVNDSLGMAAGDVVLAAVARRLEHVLRPNDVLARIGGDEFMVLLPEIRPIEATVVAERLRLAVAGRPLAISNATTELTISLAITQMDDSLTTLEHVLDQTRFALRASKDSGKNRVTTASATEFSRSGFADEVQSMITTPNRLRMAFQPLIDLDRLEVVGYELLVRDTEPPHVPPTIIFQQAAESGRLTALDERCLSLALEALSAVDPQATCHLNIYPSTLLQLSPETFTRYFQRPDASRLCIELSEQQIIGDPTYLLPALQLLRSFGVKIALDDVGFGRTALESLIVLEPEIVKIDRVYVNGVNEDPVRQGWLRRLVRSAQSLDATLVAEGVEQIADVATLRDLGIAMAQGYLYGRPVPAEQILPFGPLQRPLPLNR